MKIYNCKVRLHGDVRDEVRRKNVTSGEIRVLRQIHGDDAVIEISPLGKEATSTDPVRADAPRTDAEERARLEAIYGEKAVALLFGAKQTPIDEEIDDGKQIKVARRGPVDADALVD